MKARRMPGWARAVLERPSDLRVEPSCSALVRPLELVELAGYQQSPRGAVMSATRHLEVGNTLWAATAGEVRCNAL